MQKSLVRLNLADPNRDTVFGKETRPVAQPSSDTIQELVDGMTQAIIKRGGTGVLAGPQIFKLVQIIVIMRQSSPDNLPLVFMNPVVSYPSRTTETKEETFLGDPSINGLVKRHTMIDVGFTDTCGERKSTTLEGETARLFLQGYDTLQGVLFTSRIITPEVLSETPVVAD